MEPQFPRPLTISLWFACRQCGYSFETIDKFVVHKKLSHSIEIHRIKCIVFEERIIEVEEVDDDDLAEIPEELSMPIDLTVPKATMIEIPPNAMETEEPLKAIVNHIDSKIDDTAKEKNENELSTSLSQRLRRTPEGSNLHSDSQMSDSSKVDIAVSALMSISAQPSPPSSVSSRNSSPASLTAPVVPAPTPVVESPPMPVSAPVLVSALISGPSSEPDSMAPPVLVSALISAVSSASSTSDSTSGSGSTKVLASPVSTKNLAPVPPTPASTTSAPITLTPTTSAPTTSAPTTSAPTTSAPITLTPTTSQSTASPEKICTPISTPASSQEKKPAPTSTPISSPAKNFAQTSKHAVYPGKNSVPTSRPTSSVTKSTGPPSATVSSPAKAVTPTLISMPTSSSSEKISAPISTHVSSPAKTMSEPALSSPAKNRAPVSATSKISTPVSDATVSKAEPEVGGPETIYSSSSLHPNIESLTISDPKETENRVQLPSKPVDDGNENQEEPMSIDDNVKCEFVELKPSKTPTLQINNGRLQQQYATNSNLNFLAVEIIDLTDGGRATEDFMDISPAQNQNLQPQQKKMKFKKSSDLPLTDWLIREKSKMRAKSRSGPTNIILLDPDPLSVDVGVITPANPISCKLCCKKLVSEAEVKVHVTHCWIYNKKLHRYCILCKRKFEDPYDYNKHFKSHLSKEEKIKANQAKFKCHICLKEFLTKFSYQFHMESHNSKNQKQPQPQQKQPSTP